MAIAFDAASEAISATAASSHTFAHTTGTLTNGVLVVGFSHYDLNRSATGVTYNGVALTKYIRYNNAVNGVLLEIWYLAAPASGANNVIITMDAALGVGQSIISSALTFSGMDQTTVIHATHAKSIVTGTHAAHSDSLTAATADSLFLDMIACPTIPTVDAGQTERTAQEGSSAHGLSTEAPSGSTTMGWTYTSSGSATAHIIVELLVAAVTVGGGGAYQQYYRSIVTGVGH